MIRSLLAAALTLVGAGVPVAEVLATPSRDLNRLADAVTGAPPARTWKDYDRKYKKRKAAGYPENFSSLPKKAKKKYQRRKKG
jgi:hypothetical protein